MGELNEIRDPIDEKIYDLIKKSGNSFHATVARWFSDNDWHVVVSPYYMDQTQNKAREIDLVAEKLWPVDKSGPQDYVAVRLFIECKFVASPSVFWFAEKDRKSAQELVCVASSPFRANNIDIQEHHYLAQSSKVAKLFATDARKAPENEPFYKALNQVLNAMVSMRKKPISTPAVKKFRSQQAVLEFPVVVCSSFDQIYSVDFYTGSQPKPIEDNFQLEVRYAYIDRNNKQRDDYFLLDFVEFNQLGQFAAAIDRNAKIAAKWV